MSQENQDINVICNSQRGAIDKDMAFLRQLIEDGSGTVVVNNRDKQLLYDKEIQEQKLLKAAMKMSPDDGEALLYIGSFSKKVFDKRKPRPREILQPPPPTDKDPLKGLELPCDKIVPLDLSKPIHVPAPVIE